MYFEAVNVNKIDRRQRTRYYKAKQLATFEKLDSECIDCIPQPTFVNICYDRLLLGLRGKCLEIRQGGLF